MKRRAHTKSKNGCDVCKRRRIRCDESEPQCLNCRRRNEQCSYPTRMENLLDRSRVTASSVIVLGVNANVLTIGCQRYPLCYVPNPRTGLDEQERLLLSQNLKFLEVSQGVRSGSFNLSLLPEFHRIANTHAHVRYCICALLSTHLALLTKSSSYIYVGCKFKALALRGLRDSLHTVDEQSADAMLAACILLSWQAPASNEFVQHMRGVNLALEELHRLGHYSYLRSMWQHQSATVQPVIATEDTSQTTRVFDITFSSLTNLRSIVRDNKELSRGAVELFNFVLNLKRAPPGSTLTEQLKAVYPIRYALMWIPESLYRLADNDPMVTVFLAHYHMVGVAVEPLLPIASSIFPIAKRANLIEETYYNLWNSTTYDVPGSSSTKEARQLLLDAMAGPLEVAKIYRASHANNR